MTFPRTVFDERKAARLIECVKRYRRSINENTMQPGAPIHDEFSNGADGLRYLSIVETKWTNEYEKRRAVVQRHEALDAEIGI